MTRHTFKVDDLYNVFGGGHRYALSLYDSRGRRVGYWEFDSFFPAAAGRLARKIRRIQTIYGATRGES